MRRFMRDPVGESEVDDEDGIKREKEGVAVVVVAPCPGEWWSALGEPLGEDGAGGLLDAVKKRDGMLSMDNEDCP